MSMLKLCLSEKIYSCVDKVEFGAYSTNRALNLKDGFRSFVGKKALIPRECIEFSIAQARDLNQLKNRPGGDIERESLEMLANTLQGKYAECILYKLIGRLGLKCSEVDFARTEHGKGDSGDLIIEDRIRCQVKTMSNYSNCLLIETKNINKTLSDCDIFSVVRVKPHITESFLLSCGITSKMFKDNIDVIFNMLSNKLYDFEVTGFATIDMLKEAIKQGNIVYKNYYLGRSKLDAENYYIVIKDFLPIKSIFTF